MKSVWMYAAAFTISLGGMAVSPSAQTRAPLPGHEQGPANPLPRIPKTTCEQIQRIVQATPGTIVDIFEGTFNDPDIAHPLEGCMIVISGTWGELDETPSPTDAVFEYLSDQDWTQRTAYSSDGPDGTSFSFYKEDVMCIVRGRWDGGDDSDSTYVPSDVYQIIVYCVTIEPGECQPLIEE